MGVKELEIIIRAQNQTTPAFRGVVRNLEEVQGALRMLAVWQFNMPRAIYAGFNLMGLGIQGMARQGTAAFTRIRNDLAEEAKGHLRAAAAAREQAAALLQLSHAQQQMASALGPQIQDLMNKAAAASTPQWAGRYRAQAARLGVVQQMQQASAAASMQQFGVKMSAANIAQKTGEEAAADAIQVGKIGQAFNYVANAARPVLGIIGEFAAIGARGLQTVLDILMRIAQTVIGEVIAAFKRLVTIVLVGAVAMAAGLAMLVRHGLEVRQSFEAAAATYQLILGGAKASQTMLAAVRGEARRSSIDFKSLNEQAQALVAFGFQAKEIAPILHTLSSAALVRGTEGAEERLSRLVVLLGRIKSEGFLQGREALSMERMGFDIRSMLHIPMGANLNEMKLEANKVIPAILDALKSQFGGVQESMKNSLQFAMSALRDSFDAFSAQVSGGFERHWAAAVRNVTAILDTMSGSGTETGLSSLFTTIASGIQDVTTLLPALKALLDDALSSKGFQDVLGVIKELFGVLQNGILWVTQNFVRMIQSDQFAQVIQDIINIFLVFAGVASKWISTIANDWGTIWPFLKLLAVGALTFIADVIGGLINILVEMSGQIKNNGDFWKMMADAVKGGGSVIIDVITKIVQAYAAWEVTLGGIVALTGALMANPAMVGMGAEQMIQGGAMGFLAGIVGKIAIMAIQGMDTSGIAKSMGDKWNDISKQAGPVGAFVRGYNETNRQINSMTAASPPANPKLDSSNPDLFTPPDVTHRGKLPGALPEVIYLSALESLKKTVDFLKEERQALVEISKLDGDRVPTSQQLVQVGLAELRTLEMQRAAQEGLIGTQQRWSDNWIESQKAIAANVKEVAAVDEEIRNIIFDTKTLDAQLNEGEKLMKIAKEAGFPDPVRQNLGNEQFNIMEQTLMVERARLGTLREGSQEWFKQRATILDIILKMVELKKELQDANQLVQNPMLGMPNTPFGTRGPGPEVGPYPNPNGLGDFSKSVMDLIGFMFNGPKIDLNSAAMAVAGGVPTPEAQAEDANQQAARAGGTMNNNFALNVFGNINDANDVKAIMTQFVEAKIDETLKKLTGWGYDRYGQRPPYDATQ